MPKLLKKLAFVYLFQWYALFVYWQFITPMLRASMFGISNEDTAKYDGIMEACKSGAEISAADTSFVQNIQHLSEQALAQTGLMNGTYNLVTMLVALVLVTYDFIWYWLGCDDGYTLRNGFKSNSRSTTWRLYGHRQYDDCNSYGNTNFNLWAYCEKPIGR